MNSISVENLNKNFKDFNLENISFSVPQGEIVGLIGENGAGKTTLINSLLKLLLVESGKIKFWEEDFEKIKEKVGVLYDSLYFNENLRPTELEKIFAASYKNWDRNLFFKLLGDFGIEKTKKIKTLSKGMKIKLQLALALAHKPKLLIIDEATSGLDPLFIDSFLDLLLDFMQDETNSVFISSHDLSHLEKIADRFIMIDQGKLLLNEDIEKIRDHYGYLQIRGDELKKIEPRFVSRFLKHKFNTEVLIQNKEAFEQEYPIKTEPVSVEQIFKFLVRGEKYEKLIN